MVTEPQQHSEVDTSEAFFAMQADEVLRVLGSDTNGLSSAEAERRRLEGGRNEISTREGSGRAMIFLHQFANPLILLLLAAAGLTILFREHLETGVILAAVLVNAGLGFWQETKAEHALALLRTYIRTRARIRRDTLEHDVDAAELVRGDIIRVSRGDRVPADCRILFAVSLEVDEAVLTGESLPVKKSSEAVLRETFLADRRSALFGGTLVVNGFADAVVTAIGDRTEFGRIASLVGGRRHEATPLQRSLNRFVLQVSGALVVFIGILFAVGVYVGYGAYEMFLIAVAVAVSAVPEGMPVALTVILAIGVERLARHQGVVRRLLAAETLGGTTVILTDKTGTLTQGRMEVSAVLPYGGGDSEDARELLRAATLNTDVIIENPDASPEVWQIVGRPVEVAIVRAASREGLRLPEILRETKVLDRMPFNSNEKFSASLSLDAAKKRMIVLLGAPDVLLEYADLDDATRARIVADIDQRAISGEKVVGVCVRDVPASMEQIPPHEEFSKFRFAGIVALRDPLRPQARGAIERIGRTGVRTIMVTGDHRGTAEAIARELGMADGPGAVLTGSELAALSDVAWLERADGIRVYARTTPEDKVRITRLFQGRGEVVAVTGDGVNDAPALEAADIGVAVGSGTDVAKSAADLVILDDNFETLVLAIEEGRTILANIRKVVVYLLSTSLDELFLIGGALVLGVALPLNALQILFVNFFSDSFPAVALAFERDEGGKRPDGKNLLNGRTRALILILAVLTASLLFALYAFLLARGYPEELVRTFTFAAFASYSLGVVFSLRNLERNMFTYRPFSNRGLVVGVLIGLTLTAGAVYLPFLQEVFDTVSLPLVWVFGVVAVGFVSISMVEFGKWLVRDRAL